MEDLQHECGVAALYHLPGPKVSSLVPDGDPKNVTRLMPRMLIDLQNRISKAKNEALLGRTFEVLVEGPTDELPGQFTGLTRTHKTVNFPARPELVGQMVAVRAVSAHTWGFMGEMTE